MPSSVLTNVSIVSSEALYTLVEVCTSELGLIFAGSKEERGTEAIGCILVVSLLALLVELPNRSLSSNVEFSHVSVNSRHCCNSRPKRAVAAISC